MIRKIVALLVMVGASLPVIAHADASCATAEHPGGDWPTYGQDAGNTRHQEAETSLTPAVAATLVPAWTFSSVAAGGSGDFTGTAVIEDGCVYVGSNTGWVFALNAESGELVWSTLLDAPQVGFLAGGGIPGSLAVANGLVYVNASRNPEPLLAALDQTTGTVEWQTTVSDRPGTTLYSSPAVVGDLIWVGVSAPNGGGSGSIVLVDATSGVVVEEIFTIPEELWDDGFQGAGVWSTPAYDAATGVAFVGTGEPDAGGGEVQEHANTNAVIAVDVDQASETFGEVLWAYKGDDDGVDFGASPTLFRQADGRLLVGNLQRNGSFHAIDAATGVGAWSSSTGPRGPHRELGDAGSPANDGDAVFTSSNPGIAFSFDGDSGATNWASPTADAVRYNPMSAAAGVVYTVNVAGFLDGYDASTGALIVRRPLAGPETGLDPTVALASGVSIARGKVFATVGTSLGENGFVVAFQAAA